MKYKSEDFFEFPPDPAVTEAFDNAKVSTTMIGVSFHNCKYLNERQAYQAHMRAAEQLLEDARKLFSEAVEAYNKSMKRAFQEAMKNNG